MIIRRALIPFSPTADLALKTESKQTKPTP
jgi:hypothetical protein